MKKKMKSIIIIILILFSIYIPFFDSYSKAMYQKTSSNNINNINLQKRANDINVNGTFALALTEVISEPMVDQNKNDKDSINPQIAVEDDKIYVVWGDSTNLSGSGSDSDIFYRYYYGNIWSEIQVISEPINGKDLNTAGSGYPSIAVEDGSIYVVWGDYNNTNGAGEEDSDIFYRCNLSGMGWGDIQVISEPELGNNINNGWSYFPEIAVSNSKVYVVWEDNSSFSGSGVDDDEIYFRCNTTGSSWEEIQIVSEPVFGKNINTGWSYNPSIAAENGNIYIIWEDLNNTNGAGYDEDIFYRCNLSGSGWSEIQVISEPVEGNNYNTALSWDPDIAVANGNIHVIWMDLENYTGAGDSEFDVFYRGNLSGSGWGEIQVISEPIPGVDINIGDGWNTAVAAENNNVYIVWEDDNVTDGSGIDSDIFYRCNLNNTGWRPVIIASEPVAGKNLNYGASLNPDIAVSSGIPHIVWEDNTDLNNSKRDWDIFYRTAEFLPMGLVFPNVKPYYGNTSTCFNFTITYFHLLNNPPTNISVNLDNMDYSMLEAEPSDLDYSDGKKYYYNIDKLALGNHSYRFMVYDGENSIFSKFDNITIYNTPPRIITKNNLIAMEDQYYEENYEFEDMDFNNVCQNCCWDFTTNASWVNFNLTTAILYGSPSNNDVGKYWINISINDTICADSTNFSLRVFNVNDHPEITTKNIDYAYEDELFVIDYNASDVDSAISKQEWRLETNASSWLKIQATTGILNGLPVNKDVGNYWVNVSVSDGKGGADYTNFTLEVINVNDPPKITTTDITIAEPDKLYMVDYNATDVDSPKLKQNWLLSSNASWLTINPNTGVLYGTPDKNDTGQYNVNVTVEDGDGAFDWHEFLITVIELNKAPIITTKDVDFVMFNETYRVDYNAYDDRTPVESLSWRLKTNASWLTLDKQTGLLYGAPSELDIGSYWVNVTVSDGEGKFAYHNFTLTVTRPPKIPDTKPENRPPILSNYQITPTEGDTETEFTFSLHYYDPDNDLPSKIQIIIDGKAYNMTLKAGENATNGTYIFKTKLSKGAHNFYFSTSDGNTTVFLEDLITPDIKEKTVPHDKESEFQWFIWIIIILIIILLTIFSIILRIKKRRRDILYEEHEPRLIPITSEVSIDHKNGNIIKTSAQSTYSSPASPVSPASRATSAYPLLNAEESRTTMRDSASAHVPPRIQVKPSLPILPGIKMVGRDDELNEVLAYMDKIFMNESKTIFISGEAGIGKTRLVEELKRYADVKGFQILSGNCVYKSMTPYMPVLEALRSKDLDYLFVEEVPRVEAVYLMTHSGLLIKEVLRAQSELDPNLFTAMLFSVNNFLKESLSMLLGEQKEGTINTLGYEKYRILIESGSNANLVVIISGRENEILIKDIQEIFVKLNTRYASVLENWDRTNESIMGIDIILQPLISSGKYDGISYAKLDPKAKRGILFENISTGITRYTEDSPTILVLEDLQWADPSSLALLYYIAKNNKNSKLLIIGTYRPEDIISEEMHHPLVEILQMMDREDLAKELKLERLPEEYIPEFLFILLGNSAFTNEFRSKLYSETEGNPLFLIQLIKYLVEERIISSENDVWKLKRELEDIEIPSKIYNVIARRLDKLDREPRKVLDYASVIGNTFDSVILTHALNQDRVWLLEQLKELEKTHRLIHSLNGKFKFDHEKIREVLYNELPTELKKEYHALIASIIENQNQDNLEPFIGELALHYYQCRNKTKALYYLTRAADEAKKSLSNEVAIRLYKQVLEFEETSEGKIKIFESLGDINFIIKDLNKSKESYSNALKLAKGSKKAELMAKLGGILERQGRYDESLKLCKSAFELVKGQNSKEEALALQNLGNVLLFNKDYNDALEYYERSLEIRTKINDEQGIAACNNNIGLVYYGKGEYNKALGYLETSLKIRTMISDKEGIASTFNNIGATYQMLGDIEKANNYYYQCQEIRRLIGDPSTSIYPVHGISIENHEQPNSSKNNHLQ